MLRTILLLLGIVSTHYLRAQDSPEQKRMEIGLNVSNVLANFFNSDFPRAEQERHTLGLKYNAKNLNSAWRLHLGGGVKNSETLDNFGGRQIEESSLFLKLGYEWRKSILPQFALLYGIDLIANTTNEKSSFRFGLNNDTADIKKIRQYGSGLFLGFRYEFAKRFALTTESNLSVLYQTENSSVLDINGQLVKFHSDDFQISHTLPISLYLYIRL